MGFGIALLRVNEKSPNFSGARMKIPACCCRVMVPVAFFGCKT